MNSLVKLLVIVAITGVLGGLLAFTVYYLFNNSINYPSPDLPISILAGLCVSFIIYLFYKLVINKLVIELYILKGIACIAAVDALVLIFALLIWGVDLRGMLLCTITYGLSTFFMPYLDRYFSKYLTRSYYDN